MGPTRPALRYHGGKWLLAPWILEHLPPHRIYVEPYGGAASVLLRKPRAYAEVYNDLDREVAGYFAVLRDEEQAANLIELIRRTAFARAEFELAYEPTNAPVERARRLVVRSFMGFGSDGFNSAVRTGFRAASNRSGTTPAHDWSSLPEKMAVLTERLKGVVIESRHAIDVMQQHDSDETLHYVDPPYLPETRSQKSRRGKIRYHAYRHEMTPDDHEQLGNVLRELSGMVVVSGYPSAQYERLFGNWYRTERVSLADGARPRTEVLWLNSSASDALHKHCLPLFETAGAA